MKNNIEEVFKSRARFSVLRCLFWSQNPLQFRQIVAREGLGIRSVQLTLQQLRVGKVIRRVRVEGGFDGYELNRQHPLIPTLNQLLEIDSRQRLHHRCQALRSRACFRFERLGRLHSELGAMRRNARKPLT